TGMDEANILMAMSASRQEHSCKVVAKINRKSLIDLVSTTGMIDSVVSAGAVTEELILQYVRAMENASGSQVKTLHLLVDGRVEAMEFSVTADISFVDLPLKSLPLKSGILVAGIVRQNGKLVIPTGEDAFHLGDDVILVTTNTALQDLRDILQ
ncbi:MAG: TrkA C-terminal domain-containing protein, partial [Oscillibacter sp.]